MRKQTHAKTPFLTQRFLFPAPCCNHGCSQIHGGKEKGASCTGKPPGASRTMFKGCHLIISSCDPQLGMQSQVPRLRHQCALNLESSTMTELPSVRNPQRKASAKTSPRAPVGDLSAISAYSHSGKRLRRCELEGGGYDLIDTRRRFANSPGLCKFGDSRSVMRAKPATQ